MRKKRRVFELDYILRFGLICVIAISVIVMIWTYKSTSNEVVSIDDANNGEVLERFEELRLESDWGRYQDIEDYRQKKVKVVEIDREEYNIDPRVFIRLPFVPYDWGKIKYAVDSGYFTMLSRATEDYYLHPEFYDDWDTMGRAFYANPTPICKSGFFSTPTGQRLYTKAGSSVETYMLVHSSYCVGNPQAISFEAFYPEEGVTDDGIEYEQDPRFVQRYITLDFSPNDIVLGKAYPQFEKDWANKIKVTVSVSALAPKGMYIAAVGAAGHDPGLDDRKNINIDAYTSKGGSPLMYLIIAVD